MQKRFETSTPYAILGMLTLRPMSGYDMKQLIQESIIHFWNESYGQLYPTLKKLAARGLSTVKTEKKAGKPDRQVYAITDKGRKELERWLAEDPRSQPNRSEILLKLFFASGKPEIARHHVSKLRESCVADLQRNAAIESGLKQACAGDPQLPYWLFTLNFGRHRSQAMLDWANETLTELEQLDSAPNGDGR